MSPLSTIIRKIILVQLWGRFVGEIFRYENIRTKNADNKFEK